MIRAACAHRPSEMYEDVASITDIKTYFARPRFIENIQYNQTVASNIKTYTITNNTVQAQFGTSFQRLAGSVGWRGTVCYRIQAVSQPFQGGRIKLAFEPLKRNTHNRAASITPISQLPGVELDISESSACVIKIPYIHPRQYFTVVKTSETPDQQDLGLLHFYAYTPVVLAAGAVSPYFAVWVYIEDLELIGAGPVAFQSGKFQKTAASREEAAIPGNLSNVLMAGSKLISWGGSQIPLISSFSGTASWMVRQMANIAAAHGWAKPLDTTPIQRITNTSNIYQHNVCGVDASFNLGAFPDNAVAPYSGFAGTDLDEMSFDYIKKVYSAINIGTLVTGRGPGEVLYTCMCTPSAMYRQSTTNNVVGVVTNGRSIWPSSVMGLSNCFQQFRGGFKFRIKMSKTGFHTGRLLLGFNAYDPLAGPNNSGISGFVPVDRLDMQFMSKVWDLSDTNVMEFEVPFLCSYPYVDNSVGFGTFFISIISGLQAPDTVSQSVPFVVEVCGADDFEVASPVTGIMALSPQTAIFMAQAGTFQPFLVPKNSDVAQYAVGEKLLSIKELISRASLLATYGNGAVTHKCIPTIPIWDNNVTPTTLTEYDPTAVNYWSAFYALYRGGHNFDAISTNDRTTITARLMNLFRPNNANWVANVMEPRAALHIKIPYYCKTTRSITYSVGIDQPENYITTYVSQTAAGGGTVCVYKRAADDYQLGYYLGCPPLTPQLYAGQNSMQTSLGFIAAAQQART